MHKDIIFFTDRGSKTADRINGRFTELGIETATVFHGSADDFARNGFREGHALIFVGAIGIAVRAISPYVKDKLSDSPVIVVDDAGRFVIPILAAHAGGAGKLAVMIAEAIDAVPVLTTSTDVNGAFSADVFAGENHLTVRNRDGIKKVSTKALEGKAVTISIKDYPPAEQVDIIIADETDREYSLLLSPKRYTVGIGLKRGKSPEELERFILDVLAGLDIDTDDVYAISTIDIKEEEEALLYLRDKYRIPLITFEAAVLEKAQGDFTSSDFVKETVGVDNVCERCAVLAAGPGAELILAKTCGEGMTVAIAKRRQQS